jgi:hypothetical protein
MPVAAEAKAGGGTVRGRRPGLEAHSGGGSRWANASLVAIATMSSRRS